MKIVEITTEPPNCQGRPVHNDRRKVFFLTLLRDGMRCRLTRMKSSPCFTFIFLRIHLVSQVNHHFFFLRSWPSLVNVIYWIFIHEEIIHTILGHILYVHIYDQMHGNNFFTSLYFFFLEEEFIVFLLAYNVFFRR